MKLEKIDLRRTGVFTFIFRVRSIESVSLLFVLVEAKVTYYLRCCWSSRPPCPARCRCRSCS